MEVDKNQYQRLESFASKNSNLETQLKITGQRNFNTEDEPQKCPCPHHIKVINPHPLVPELSLSENGSAYITNIISQTVNKIDTYDHENYENIHSSIMLNCPSNNITTDFNTKEFTRSFNSYVPESLYNNNSLIETENIPPNEQINAINCNIQHVHPPPLYSATVPEVSKKVISNSKLKSTLPIKKSLVQNKHSTMPKLINNTAKSKVVISQNKSVEFNKKMSVIKKKISSLPLANQNTEIRNSNPELNEISNKTNKTMPEEIYRLLHYQNEQLQHLQNQIDQLLEARIQPNESEMCSEKPITSNSVSTMTSLLFPSVSHHNQIISTDECLQTNESDFNKTGDENCKYQTSAVQTSVCESKNSEDKNIKTKLKAKSPQKNECEFVFNRNNPNNENFNTRKITEALSLGDVCLDTICDSRDSQTSLRVNVEDYPTSVYSQFNMNSEGSVVLGESASTKARTTDNVDDRFYENILKNVKAMLSEQAPYEEHSEESSKQSRETNLQTFRETADRDILELEKSERVNIPETDPNKTFYSNLLSNIKKFLSEDQTTELKERTEKYLHETGHSLNSRSNYDVSNELCLPRLEYWTYKHHLDIDSSMEINALALKYLGDEQLSQIARSMYCSESHFLKTIRETSEGDPTDLTIYGLSPSNASFATKKYLEKHGLVSLDTYLSDKNYLMRRDISED